MRWAKMLLDSDGARAKWQRGHGFAMSSVSFRAHRESFLATVRLCVVSKQSAAPIRGQPGSWAIVKSCIQSSICSNLKHSQHGWRRLCTCSPIHEVREAQNASNTGGPTKFNAGHVTHIPIMIRLRQCSAPPHSRRCTPRAASARGLKLSLLSCRF